MLSWVIIVDDELDDVAIVEDKRVAVNAVDAGVGDNICRSGESRVESGYFLGDIGDSIEKCTAFIRRPSVGTLSSILSKLTTGAGISSLIHTVSKNIHVYLQGDRMVDVFENLKSITRNEVEVVERAECADFFSGW